MQRRQWIQQSIWATLWLAGCGGSGPSDPAPPRFQLQDLGSLDDYTLSVTAINDHGDTAGMATEPGGRTFAFVHAAGRMVDLSALYAGTVQPLAINDAGHVAGRCVPDDPSDVVGMEPERPFVFDGVSLRQLRDELGEGGEAWSINDTGAIAGRTNVLLDTEDSRADAFSYDGTTARLLGHLGGRYSEGRAINASGWVAGFSQVAPDVSQSATPPFRAFRHDGAAMHDLGTLGGANSFGFALNAAGWVAGRSEGTDGLSRAFLHDGVTMHDLGLLDGRPSVGTAINDAGQVAGHAGTAGSPDQVAVISHGGRLHDLNELLVDPSDWRLAEAQALTHDGRVLVRGHRAAEVRSFLLIPVP